MASKSNDFHSLLSVFRDATAAPSTSSGTGTASQKSSESASSTNRNGQSIKIGYVDLTSTTDPSFSAAAIKEHVERLLRINSIRKSTTKAKSSNSRPCSTNACDSVHIAICSTIVQDFPHELLWKKWINETGGDIEICLNQTKSAVDEEANNTMASCRIKTSAELYIHAKNPEGIQSDWLKSKTIPITHRPNWNDVRIIRAMLSLLEAALRDEKTTHILFCTESCVPVVTLKEAAFSILADKPCLWEENSNELAIKQPLLTDVGLDWDRSYVDCYDGNSSRCSRFDEHNCWGHLRNSIPSEAIYKALPGWCFLSRKHAQQILDLPSQLNNLNLWPAFEKVWAPEEVYFPTALNICGVMDDVAKRTVTHSKWDHKAANLQDRAHPLCYDGRFDDELVRQVRRDGCLFLRKMRQSIDLDCWQEIIIHHKKGRDLTSSRNHQHYNSNRERERADGRNRDRADRYHSDYSCERGSTNNGRHRYSSNRQHYRSDELRYCSERYRDGERKWKRRKW